MKVVVKNKSENHGIFALKLLENIGVCILKFFIINIYIYRYYNVLKLTVII